MWQNIVTVVVMVVVAVMVTSIQGRKDAESLPDGEFAAILLHTQYFKIVYIKDCIPSIIVYL